MTPRDELRGAERIGSWRSIDLSIFRTEVMRRMARRAAFALPGFMWRELRNRTPTVPSGETPTCSTPRVTMTLEGT
jgi:hypothetical protein